MPGDADYSPGEIARTLHRLETSLGELRGEVASLSFVRSDVFHEAREAINERIATVQQVSEASIAEVRTDLGKTQDNLRWLVRAFVGAFVVVIVGAITAGVHP